MSERKIADIALCCEWNDVMLQEVADIVMGQSPPGATYNEDRLGLPFFQGTRDFAY